MEKENKKLKWCFGIKGGLKILEPNERLARSYLNEAKQSLERAEKNFNDGDLLCGQLWLFIMLNTMPCTHSYKG